MPSISRRHLLAGTAAVAALSAMPACAQSNAQSGAAEAATPDLSGKSVLITGCSSGFGYLGALHYARAGAKVFATMRNTPRPEAEELMRIAEEENLDLAVIRLDVLLDHEIADAIASVERELDGGMVDVLVNNAGIGNGLTVELQDMEATQLIFDTNVFGYQRMARAVLPGMRARGSGQIFNVSSQLGRVIAIGYGHYCATKFAVEAMSEQMAYELVPHGVEVTIIQPGGYPTEIWRNSNRYTEQLLDRLSEAEEAAYLAFVQNAMRTGGGSDTDPMDIPRAIAEIIAMPPGTRPLRRAVHPRRIPQEEINRVARETQLAMYGGSQFAPWVESVLD
ncbi:MAG: SDR family NAD(P)-dependent oxidoreductase [Parasphingopyxis sp.]|uniref:SDR family NAD(P)-dependent oxidoreductase n=1 Tax=Parasphingopyxis sp. TaxID=1920299 RepID=UPI003F9FCA8A